MILGLGCQAQVGKDTATAYLIKKFPERAAQISFADKVKAIAMDLFDLSYDQCYGSAEFKEAIDIRYNLTPRQILMGIGDQLRQVYSPVWIDYVFRKTIPELKTRGYSLFIFSDVRYPNEAKKIKEHGGTVVRLKRDGVGVKFNKDHASETSLLDYPFDQVIENNGTIQEFYEKLDKLVIR